MPTRTVMLIFGLLLALTATAQRSAETTPAFAYRTDEPGQVQVLRTLRYDDVSVQEVTFRNELGHDVTAYVVRPDIFSGRIDYPGIVYQHWGGADYKEFLQEAMEMARWGAFCLLLQAPWPTGDATSVTYDDLVREAAANVRLGLELLRTYPQLDTGKLAFVGHGFGAAVGSLLAGVEPRLGAYVLMAGPAEVADLQRERPLAPEHVFRQGLRIRTVSYGYPLDLGEYLANKQAPVLHQLAGKDTYFPTTETAWLVGETPAPCTCSVYETDHELDEQAQRERMRWLKRYFKKGEAASKDNCQP